LTLFFTNIINNSVFRGIIKQNTIYDKLIFGKIRNLFGGNVVRSATGSAPIKKEVMEFARSAFSCPVYLNNN